MSDSGWLVSDGADIDAAALRQIERELPTDIDVLHRGAESVPSLAVSLHDVVIHSNRKWFGDANIRIDSLIVHGNGEAGDVATWYSPATLRFARVADGEYLPIDRQSGALLFYGRPFHFLSMFITVSRDAKDTDELSALLRKELHDSADMKAALTTVMGLAVAAPQAAVVVGAVQAAALVGDLAYQVIQGVTSRTVGLYHAAWLQHRDGFGVGRHPDDPQTSFRVKDLSFWYDVRIEEDD
jgi:hypothetical protein